MSLDRSRDIERWRAAAKECRTAAAQVSSIDARKKVLEIAVFYEQMADRAERSEDGRNSN